MVLLNTFRLKFDKHFRKKYFAKVVVDGICDQIEQSIIYVKSHIRCQEDELQVIKNHWHDRLLRMNSLYEKLNSYGYKNRSHYFETVKVLNTDVIDLVEDINRSVITSEAENDYQNSIKEYSDEIEASNKVLSSLEAIFPLLVKSNIESLENLDYFFEKNDCSYLLNMDSVIDVSKILYKHYYQKCV